TAVSRRAILQGTGLLLGFALTGIGPKSVFAAPASRVVENEVTGTFAPKMSNGLFIAGTYPAKRQITEEKTTMKAIVVTDQAAGTAGRKLEARPEPQAAINDVVVQVHASGFVPTELAWPSTWTDRLDHDRTPSIPGHELAGVVTALGYGTTGLSEGQRVFG